MVWNEVAVSTAYSRAVRIAMLSSRLVWGLWPLSSGAAIPTIYTQASPNPNGLNHNVTVGRNSVRIAAPGNSGPVWGILHINCFVLYSDYRTAWSPSPYPPATFKDLV